MRKMPRSVQRLCCNHASAVVPSSCQSTTGKIEEVSNSTAASSFDAVLLLLLLYLCLLLGDVELLLHLRFLVIEYDEIAVAHIEARQMVAGVLSIVDVLIDHECRALSVGRCPHPDLLDSAILSEQVVELLGGDVEGQVPHVEDLVDLRGEARLRK